jgi:hypothetical protein
MRHCEYRTCGRKNNENIQVFLSLFKGREDVFAIRWEKGGKSGYMPAYDLNWNEYSKHKARGGTLKDFADKRFSKLRTLGAPGILYR